MFELIMTEIKLAVEHLAIIDLDVPSVGTLYPTG